ncbi:MAG: sulfotransferase [Halioglobus sp.]|nr:sulfotransferase [Halioglobus sp.]
MARLDSMSTYLFVLCPPYSGSTLLWKLLSTSANVSALPTEGQFLPELEHIMREKPWRRDHPLPWIDIKRVWERYWDSGKPVLLEKSPPNLIRPHEILAHFDPVRFIVMVRNPYAQAEGLMRRNNWTPSRAANFSMMCLRTQLDNANALQDTLVITYESLVQDPATACGQLADFMPALSDMDPSANFEIHSIDGTRNRPITDLNSRKIAALTADQIAGLNSVFQQHVETIAAWDYELIPTPPPDAWTDP